ncbi:MAG: ABC transporter permease [Bacteroidota bacterium]|nr:ABC transporter permease [Odoribacter sp.]MDP3642104.1 ABC transporter permease [Bacteroidota bacterium]
MKTIFYVIQKEFIQVKRNKVMLRMIVMIPLMQMLVLVFAATFDLKNVDIFLVDKDMSSTSRELASKLEASPFFTINNTSFNPEEGEKELLRNADDMVLVIPHGFERNLIRDDKASLQLLVNAIDGQAAQLGYSYAASVIRDFNKNIIAEWKGLPEFKAPYQINTVSRYWYNSELEYKWYMAPGVLSILVTLIGLFLSGMSLVKEKEQGTIEQLNVTPIKKIQFLTGKLIPFVIIALFDLSFGLLIAKLVFNLPIVGSLALIFGMGALYLIGILGLGLFISTIADTQQQVMFVTFFFMMVFILMGGIFTPVESMPKWAQWIDQANPIYHFMRIMRMVVLKGSGFSDLIHEFVALCILGFTFLSLAVWRYRKTA